MDFDSTIDIIIKDLREIGKIVDDLKTYPGVPRLQIELAKAKCRNAEEEVLLLKTHRPEVRSEAVLEEKKAEAPVPVEEIIEIANDPPVPAQEIKKDAELLSPGKSRTQTELSKAIGLNDRFLFISGIFGGNANAYEEALSKLSRAENLPDAKAIIMSYTGDAEETEEVTQLLEIVKRKLPPNV